MTIAKDKEVLAATRVLKWLEDFLTVVREILPT
jgi:hypothetical protein